MNSVSLPGDPERENKSLQARISHRGVGGPNHERLSQPRCCDFHTGRLEKPERKEASNWVY